MHSLLAANLYRLTARSPKLAIPRLATLVFAGLILLTTTVASAAPIIGAFAAPRSGSENLLDSAPFVAAKALFAPQFPGITYQSTQQLTPSFLSGITVLILSTTGGNASIPTPLSGNEQLALLNYVLAGGSALIMGEGGFDNDVVEQSFFAPFGMHDTGRIFGNVPVKAVTPNTNPITNGPYGLYGTGNGLNVGWFDNLGAHANPVVTLQNGLPVIAVIERGALGPGSGAVVLTADSQTLQVSQPLIQNTAQFLVPEPTTGALATVAVVFLALGVWRRRLNR
jgi:hypothetical protein